MIYITVICGCESFIARSIEDHVASTASTCESEGAIGVRASNIHCSSRGWTTPTYGNGHGQRLAGRGWIGYIRRDDCCTDGGRDREHAMALGVRTAGVGGITAVGGCESLVADGIEDHKAAAGSFSENDVAIGICTGNGNRSGRDRT